MHIYPFIVGAICLQKVLSADLHQPFATGNSLHLVPAMAALHITLLYTASVFEAIAPTVAALVPEKAPLVIGAWNGCNALARRVSHGRSTSVQERQVNS